MKIETITETISTKWLIDKEYGFEITLKEMNHLCWKINHDFGIVDVWDIPDEGLVKYLVDNEIFTFKDGGFEAGKKFNEFWTMIKSEL
jgi:hypothetical protein